MAKTNRKSSTKQSKFRKFRGFIAAAILSFALHIAHFAEKIARKEIPTSHLT